MYLTTVVVSNYRLLLFGEGLISNTGNSRACDQSVWGEVVLPVLQVFPTLPSLESSTWTDKDVFKRLSLRIVHL